MRRPTLFVLSALLLFGGNLASQSNAPRTADRKPDLSGVWLISMAFGYVGNIVADLAPDDIAPWADRLYRQRMSALGADDPWTIGCLPLGPRYITGGIGGRFARIVQTSTMILMAYEDLAYRQIYMDGRSLPKDPFPSFMGYSVGRWEGDELVIESVGFNDRTWLDFGGHPHTEALHTTERYRRTSIGQMDVQVTFEDPGAYRRTWTVPVVATLSPDAILFEYVCNENERRRTSLSGRTAEQQSVSIPPSVLAEYAGTYLVPPDLRQPVRSIQVRQVGRELFLDIDGHGNLLMVPLSQTTFSVRVLDIEFERDPSGAVTSLVEARSGMRLMKQR